MHTRVTCCTGAGYINIDLRKVFTTVNCSASSRLEKILVVPNVQIYSCTDQMQIMLFHSHHREVRGIRHQPHLMRFWPASATQSSQFIIVIIFMPVANPWSEPCCINFCLPVYIWSRLLENVLSHAAYTSQAFMSKLKHENYFRTISHSPPNAAISVLGLKILGQKDLYKDSFLFFTFILLTDVSLHEDRDILQASL